MVDEIEQGALEDLRADGDVRVVDIRARPAFRRGHIPESEHIPFHDITERVDEFADASAVVTVCEHGIASKQAASLIRAYEGVDDDVLVASLSGGIEAWDGELVASE